MNTFESICFNFEITKEQLLPFNNSVKEFIELPLPAKMVEEAYATFCFCGEANTPADSSDKHQKPAKAIPAKEPMRMMEYGFHQRVEDLIQTILDLPMHDFDYICRGAPKPVAKSGGRSITRSAYIGVTRNGKRWQSMINVGPKKVYIASYRNEKDAAVCFDLHSLMLHSITAKVNFDYTKGELLELLYAYRRNQYTY